MTAPQAAVIHAVHIRCLHYTQIRQIALLLEQKLASFHPAAVLRAHGVNHDAALHAQCNGQKGLFFHRVQLGFRVVHRGFVGLVAPVTRRACFYRCVG